MVVGSLHAPRVTHALPKRALARSDHDFRYARHVLLVHVGALTANGKSTVGACGHALPHTATSGEGRRTELSSVDLAEFS